MRWIDGVAVLVLVAGGLNAGLEGWVGWNPLAAVFGADHPLLGTGYRIAGLCALYLVVQWRAVPRRWRTAS